MPAPESVLQLVDKFQSSSSMYKSSNYNEARARMDFIDPLFVALGWDVYNKDNAFEAYKDVIVEDSLRVGGAMQAPDYSFRIGGQRVFFVEAKSPSQNLVSNAAHAFQTRQYGWWAKLPVSILTDFEELAVYDCRLKPQQGDNAKTGLLFYWRYESFESQWDEIESLISRSAVRQGSLHKFLESKKVKGRPVDEDFLDTIETWREALARNIAIRNAALSETEVNEITQRTIDRIVFLRNVQDRGIEEGMLLDSLLKGDGAWERLRNFFYTADDKYNSGLFHFQIPGKPAAKNRTESPDTLTAALTIDDKVIKDIVRGFSYPTHYNFDLISAEILGQVYERFLGKVIRLTKGHRARVEEKPEVRKAGGVYYTPEYIVRYIVEQTVGKLCEGRTLEEIAELRILDPACGSGSFLLGAFDYLMNYHLNWYVQSHTPTAHPSSPHSGESRNLTTHPSSPHSGLDPESRPDSDLQTSNFKLQTSPDPFLKQRNNVPAIVQTYSDAAGLEVWTLTVEEKRRILLNNLYGVDIDPQAVEVTKLSLLLKLMEDAKSADTNRQLKSSDRILPDLGNNIKCGNSLIGSDFYQQTDLDLTPEEHLKINVFDWEESWPEIFSSNPPDGRVDGVRPSGRSRGGHNNENSSPGFHAVIGNPPYVRQEMLGDFKDYFKTHYQTYAGTADLYTYFIERGMALLREGGKFGIIVANKWMRANYGKPLREWMKSQCIEEITDFGDLPVFTGATTYPCILLMSNTEPAETFRAANVDTLDYASLIEHLGGISFTMKREGLDDNGWALINMQSQELLDKIRSKGVPLGEYVKGAIYYGIKTGLNKAFVIDSATKERLVASDPKSADILKPFLAGRDIKRYEPLHTDKWLILIPSGWTNKRYPGRGNKWNQFKEEFNAIATHLEQFAADAEKRWDKGDFWWELRSCAYYDEFEKPKMMLPDITLKGNVMLDTEGKYYSVNTTYIIGSDSMFLLGLLNSSVINFFYRNLAASYRGGYVRYIYQYMEQIPIADPSSNPDAAASIAANAGRMLELHAQLANTNLAHIRENLERQIKAADREIDKAVGRMYGVGEGEYVF